MQCEVQTGLQCYITDRITWHGCSIFLRRQLKSQPNEGICSSTEQSEVLLDVLSVMLTLQLAPEAVNKSGSKAGFEVGIQNFVHQYQQLQNSMVVFWPIF